MDLIGRCFPWEQARALRVLRVVTGSQLRRAAEIEELLRMGGNPWMASLGSVAAGGRFSGPWANLPDANFADWVCAHWLPTTPHVSQLVPEDLQFVFSNRAAEETYRRVLVLELALLSWKKRHGQLPERLGDLSGKVPGVVLHDPWKGREFLYHPKGFRDPQDGITKPVIYAQVGGPFSIP